MAKKRAFKLKDIFKYRALSGLTAAPDGTAVAFAVSQPDLEENKATSCIWTWSEEEEAQQVTFDGKASQPAFSPDGRRLAFLSDRGSEKPQLYVMDGLFSEGRRITEFENGVVKFRWSPDGRRLAVVAKPDRTEKEKKDDEEKRDWWTVDADERRRALWVFNADGTGKPRRLTEDDEHVSEAAWMPDSKALAYTACPLGSINSQWFESDLKVVDVKAKERRTVCPVRGHLMESAIHVSPDGNSLLLSESYDEEDLFHDTAKVINLESGEKQMVHPTTDMRSMAPQWLPDGRVLFEAQDATSFVLCVCEVGRKPQILDTGPCVASNAALAKDAGKLFYLYSETGEPDEVWALSLDGSGPGKALTEINRPIRSRKLAKAEVVQWENDGEQVEGVLYLPSKSGARKPYPMILMPHGGPYGASVTSFGQAVVPNIFCAAGYACFMPNFRGSTGYGRMFTRKIVRDWGEGPFADIMAGVDALIDRKLVNPKRMAVFGGSYGGYMTAWTVGHTDRFRCAVAVAAVTDNLSMWGTTDIPDFQMYSSGNTPATFTDEFWREQSPLHYVERVKTPTLVITGEVDVRVPPSQSHQFYRALKVRGVETSLVLYPREPHGVSEPRHRKHYFEQIVAYIDEHVKGK